MPRVINRHHYKSQNDWPKPAMYVGRPTALGNPFTKEEHGERAIELYKKWLWRKMQDNDKSVMAMLMSITEEHALVCSCAPRPCHADVIVAAWNWCRNDTMAGRSKL